MVLNAFQRTSWPRSRELQRLVSVSSRIKWTTSRSQSRFKRSRARRCVLYREAGSFFLRAVGSSKAASIFNNTTVSDIYTVLFTAFKEATRRTH